MKQKVNIYTYATLLILCIFAFRAGASVLFQDNFDSYSDGLLPTQPSTPSATWTNHSGTGGIAIASGQLYVGQVYSSDVSAYLAGQPYAPLYASSTVGTNVFYASFTVNFQAIPTSSGGFYFAHFKDSSSGFRGRVYALTNGAASGSFRLGIANAAGSAAATNTTDLSLSTTYTIVLRYFNPTNTFSAPSSTLWINPVSETSSSISATDATTSATLTTFAFRQPGSTTTGITSSGATMAVDNLVVGTTFADVVPASANAPSILVQPGDTNVFAGSSVNFNMFAVGDSTISYQWFYNSNTLLTTSGSIIGVNSNVLTLTGLTVGQSGTYSCVVSNTTGTNVTRYALLTVSPTPVPPTITNQPVNTTVYVGDTAALTVVAGGLPAPSYQWKYVTNNGVSNFTNNAVGANITGTNTATLTIANITTNQAGTYFVHLTNSVGTNDSTSATITVLPPPTLTIAQFRSMVDGTFAPTNTTKVYTLQGIVTTWADMTGVANTEFYMQDGTGGIAVFWSGANGTTNLPPAGALVQVTGPMSSFNGLLEIAPAFTNSLHSVTILSTNNPLPKAQPLPFDPNVTGYPATAKTATMHALESMYFVASNVTLNLSAPAFVSGANDFITNNVHKVLAATNSVITVNFTNEQGQQYILFVNGSTDIPNKAKYAGPVTIFGILGYFTAAGFEFTPSRYADIIPYTRSTNVLENLTRRGDAPTNTYTESVLRPGETLTTYISVADPEGGIVTLNPSTDGLPGSAYWTNTTSGSTATTALRFTPTTGDAGTNYVIGVGATSTSGMNVSNLWYVYVPSAQEQQVYISEFLANPTTNTSLAYFNPLHRSADTNNITVNDQFVEIVNQSGTDLDLYGWSLTDTYTRRHTFLIGAPNEQLATVSSNTAVIYGGLKTSDPNPPQLPVPDFAANVGATPSLALPSTAGGVIVLRNPKYYNDGLGIQPGYIVDRVVYSASDISTNGSLSRFPMPNGKLAFVPQAYVNTNATTAGLQYDGSSWLSPIQTPHTVSNVTVTAGNPLTLSFTADPSLMTTLWKADNVLDSFKASGGQKFGTTSGTFSITNLPPAMQFYYLTTQTNQ